MGGRGASSSAGSGGNSNSSLGGGSKSSTLREYESQHLNDQKESGLLIDESGNVLKEFASGNEKSVMGTKEDLKMMNGATFTHNHPIETTISETDIANGIVQGNLAELRATNPSGRVHILTNNGASLDQRRAFVANYGNQFMRANNNANRKISQGQNIDKQAYVSDFMSNWMANHASEYGLEFRIDQI